jgi:hypothetical protein
MRAYRAGCRTSSEIALETGLPLKHACAISRLLESRGILERKGTVPGARGSGRRAVYFEPTGQR